MAETFTLKELYIMTRDGLRAVGIDNADLVARDLLKRTLDVSDIDIVSNAEREIYSGKVNELKESLKRRIGGEPVSRIFGEREFWGIPFKITQDVLDPRPDTETIVDAALRRFAGDSPATILDLGTGSGCIVIALLKEWQRSYGVASDISEKVLAVARENAERAEIGKRLEFIRADWGDIINEQFDLIVSNPPYISNPEIPNLPPEVKNYDPILALDGGNDGLDCYRIIVREIKRLLKPGGCALLEIGFSQGEQVTRLVEDSGLSVMALHPDIAGIPRVVEISFGEK